MATRLILVVMAVVVVGAGVALPLFSAPAVEAATTPGPRVERQVGSSWLDTGCAVRNFQYAVDYIMNRSPFWYRYAVSRAWAAFRSAPNPYTAAVLAGLLGPWGHAILKVCWR